MPDVSGIAPPSRVTISGIQVGVMPKLSLDPHNCPDRARIDVNLTPNLVLYDDATAAKVATSLIGESVIVLTPGVKEPRIPNEGEIKNVLVVTDIASLEAQVSDVLKDVKAVTESLKQ